MSLSPAPVGVLLLLQQHGLLADVDSACDFGSMDFDARNPENNRPYEAFFERRNVPFPREFYAGDAGQVYGVCRDMYRALGWEYASFDFDGRWDSVWVDLNTDPIPREYHGRFGLSMNIGTSEHVFNQYNFFLQFHNVTRVGGLMFHVVPFHNHHNHGLYQYCPTFFLSLAKYNKYDVLGFWQVGKPDVNVFRSAHDRPEGTRTTLTVVMRRTSVDEFRFPLQVNEPMFPDAGTHARYGVHERKHLQEFDQRGQLPREFYLDAAAGSVHAGAPPRSPEQDEIMRLPEMKK